jgi:hypothetical protein
MFAQFKLTKTQLRISLHDETVQGLMLWKLNGDLLDLQDPKMKELQTRCRMITEKEDIEVLKEQESSLKRKSDQISEGMKPEDAETIKHEIKKTKSSSFKNDSISQNHIRLSLDKKV